MRKKYRDDYRKRNRKKLRDAAKRRHFNNRDAHLAYLKQYRQDNLSARQDYDLRRLYGISLEKYHEILEAQGGVCAICHTHPTKTRLSVDHDHQTGVIRGLLCHRCNLGIGAFCDSHERFRRVIEYLENSCK